MSGIETESQPFSAIAGWHWGNGQVHNRGYNLDGQLSSYDLAGKVYSLRYDAAGI